MPESYPSGMVVTLDIPEVKKFDAEFSYNFFTPDEKKNDSGQHKVQGTLSTIEEFELGENKENLSRKREQVVRNLAKRVPRFVKFSFTPVDVKINANFDNEFVLSIWHPVFVRTMIQKNLKLGKIHNELTVASNAFSSLNLQDENISNKTSRLLDLSVDMRTEMEGSVTDRAKILNDATSPEVDGDSILSWMASGDDFKVTGIDSNGKKIIEKSPMEGMSKINSHMQLNDKFAASILRRAAATHGPYAGQMSSLLEDALSIQNAAKKKSRPNKIMEDEYTIKIDPVDTPKPNPTGTKSGNATKVIGYIIDKNEILASGKRVKKDPIIIDRAFATAAIDAEVRYSGKYEYSIRAVALIQIEAVDEETDQLYIMSGLVTSKPSSFKVITCLDYDPPPPPADFTFVWNYQKNELMLMWNFPVVPARDIKRFQIFRRRTVDDPFTLLSEYDFDDSVVQTPRSETPRLSRVIKMKNPRTTYIDPEFNKDSTYIYTLCCLDSHDFTSNYSEQFAVSFDRFKNKLVTRLLSPAGAPKPYPNFYLREDVEADVGSTNLTVDTIKVSGHDKMTIFFDPEYLSIVMDGDNGSVSDLGLLTTVRDGGKYMMQFINTDRQVGKVLNISVEDLRIH